jgi:hypothetical protein
MNAKKFFDEAINIIENMTDKEFENLLVESGIESCPDESDDDIYLSLTPQENRIFLEIMQITKGDEQAIADCLRIFEKEREKKYEKI